ncbi:MAG TPA: acyl-CoA dehydrogenase [Firmicutes bacterium]|jgi:alkylation response protein AidB-like acyl-CoA dehydrogenase|nr:acyl-CoA dehydrogenase [Bacillota bacterium]
MDYFLTEEQQMIKDLARQIAEEKVAPIAAECDETGRFPREVFQTMGKADLFRVFVPEEYGGLGGGVFELCLVIEEISRACGGTVLGYAATGLGVFPIILYGNAEQKEKYLPRLADGEIIGAFALTEAEAGSDAGNVQAKAELDGDEYVLNGTKQWITNAGEADLYVVIATTDRKKGVRGLSAFIVEKDTPGLSFGKEEDKMGVRASATREVILQDCRIPKENLLGGEGKGFRIAMRTLDMARPGVGAQAVGIAQGALEMALQYARERVQFGKAISSFQGVQFMLADMATQIEAARALVYATARALDSGRASGKESAMAKLFASDMAMQVTSDAIQIMGGYGYMREYPAEKRLRDAKVTQIYEGTNQIQRLVIANHLLKEWAAERK